MDALGVKPSEGVGGSWRWIDRMVGEYIERTGLLYGNDVQRKKERHNDLITHQGSKVPVTANRYYVP